MNTTTFETAKTGDKVWYIEFGWGEIRSTDHSANCPLLVEFYGVRQMAFTLSGSRLHRCDGQTLFWDEVKIAAPQKPLPVLEVDTKVLVWNRGGGKSKRHFSHFNSSGKIVCFNHGLTSWTTAGNVPEPTTASKTAGTTEWNFWELAE